MFHTRTGLVSGLFFLFALTAQPMTASANGPSEPVVQTQSAVPISIKAQRTHVSPEQYFDELRFDTRVAFSETQDWVKEKTAPLEFGAFMDDLSHKTDEFQDRLAPAGSSLRTSIKSKLPGTSLVQLGDRTVSVYGLILMMAFALVVFLMGLSNPMSRLGGRH